MSKANQVVINARGKKKFYETADGILKVRASLIKSKELLDKHLRELVVSTGYYSELPKDITIDDILKNRNN